MDTNVIKNCKAFALDRRGRKPILRPGKVVEHFPFQQGDGANPSVPEQVMIELDTPIGKQIYMTVPVSDIRIIPKKIPAVWRKIIHKNIHEHGIENVGVCYLPHCEPAATTLFHKKTGEKLQMVMTETSSSFIKLWDGQDTPCESKPEVDHCTATYRVGPVELTINNVNRF